MNCNKSIEYPRQVLSKALWFIEIKIENPNGCQINRWNVSYISFHTYHFIWHLFFQYRWNIFLSKFIQIIKSHLWFLFQLSKMIGQFNKFNNFYVCILMRIIHTWKKKVTYLYSLAIIHWSIVINDPSTNGILTRVFD